MSFWLEKETETRKIGKQHKYPQYYAMVDANSQL